MRATEPPDQADHMDLAAHPIARSFARRLVERAPAKWGMEELETVASLVMTELVTNAVNATGNDASAFRNEGNEDEISRNSRCVRAGLYRMGDAVVIEVWDACRTPPRLTAPSLDDECGRGLRIVEDLSAAWGYRWGDPEGKVVWARLDLPS
ncbi:ATP-binding protein [Streptosporangium sp. NPDC051022]|uniref:ATP-binding protein n=1 Tax=Streptosporangium sp. NPDC051022 TaxID=3155752 RepID=UPI003422019B